MNAPGFGDVATTDSSHNDINPPARVVANSVWMLLAQGAATIIGGGVSIYVVRHLSASSWGHFSTALALIVVFTIFCGPGVAPLALRELAAAPQRRTEIVAASFQALAATFCVAAIALVAVTAILGYSHHVFVLVIVMAPLVGLEPALSVVAAVFNAQSRLGWIAVLQVVRATLYGTLVVLLVATSRGVTGVAVATVGAALLASVFGFILLRAQFGLRIRTARPWGQTWSFLRTALPIAGINFVGVVYDRVDIVLLSVLGTSTKVALYTVPYGFVRLSWLLPSIVSAVFFPLLSRTLVSDRLEAQYLFFLVARVFLFLSLPISLALALSSSALLPFVFGHPYEHSATVLQIMAWTSVFGFQNYILWYGLLVSHQERRAFAIQIAGLVVNVGLNSFAIPLYGANGAAAALVVSDLVVVIGQAILIHRNLFPVPFRELLTKPVGASVVALPVALFAAEHNAVAGALTGGVAYIVLLLLLRYVTFDEWRPLLAFVNLRGAAAGSSRT